jgi:4-amino-4-deoxy-L-arabinose transferase-like glycosyltransferase
MTDRMTEQTGLSAEPEASGGLHPRRNQPGGSLGIDTLFPLLILTLLCGVLFFYRLADRDLWSSHEARAAQDAQTILDDGNWGLPRLFDGHPELQKPPLYYWLVAALGWVRGGIVDAWAVRLPAALAALACVFFLYFLAGRGVAGFAAAAMLATALHFTWLARVGRIDMPLTLSVMIAVGGLWRGQQIGRWPLLFLAYLAIGCGLLLKGPIALVLPAAVLAVLFLVERELLRPWNAARLGEFANRLGLWWGVPLVLALGLPWFVWVNIQTGGEFFRVFFWHHNVERGFDGSGGLREHPWWFYGPQFAFDFLPWTLLLPSAVWLLFRRRWWQASPPARLGAVWLIMIIVLLSCVRFKRSDYLLPAFPGAALFLGAVAERWWRGWSRRRATLAAFGSVLAACIVGWFVYVERVLPLQEPQLEQRRFAEAIRRHAPPPERVLLFWAEAHPLAFHLGRPLDILIEWDDLDARLACGRPVYVVMPPDVAQRSSTLLHSARLEEVLRDTDLGGGNPKRPLVLLRSLPLAVTPQPTESTDARRSRAGSDRDRADQSAADGAQ